MRGATNVIKILQEILPPKAELIFIEKPRKNAATLKADIDGDGKDEIVGAYKLNRENYVLILKNFNNKWRVATTIKGKGYDINYLNAAPVVRAGVKNLVVGWQVGAIWSELDIYEATPRGLKEIIVKDIYYSRIEIEDMSGDGGRDGKAEIALWVHDTGDSYKVNVCRWINGKLDTAEDVYPYYFKKVAAYYNKKVRELPDAAFYWYYLADAQLKAGMTNRALRSINRALKLNEPYPSREALIKLRESILGGFRFIGTALYPASIKTINGVKWGYIDDTGNLRIKPQYDLVYEFQDNGLAIVEYSNLYGIIDESGKYLVEPSYDSISQFSEGRATVITKDGFGIIDERGRLLTQKSYSYIGSFKNQRAIASGTDNEGRYVYGYLDLEGREIIPIKYEGANDFKEGRALVKVSDNNYALINPNGEVLKSYKYYFVGDVGEGLMAYQSSSDSKYGFIDTNGNIVIPPKFTGTQPFEYGRAIVNMGEDFGNKFGLIDKSGRFLIEPNYNNIDLLGENRVAVGKAVDEGKPYMGSKFAIADINGKFLTDFIYESVLQYENGLASASDGSNTFFIDVNGIRIKNLPSIEGSGTLALEGNIIKVNADLRTFYLDKSGKVIWRQNTVIPLRDPVRIVEGKFNPNKNYLVYYPQIEGMKNKAAQQRVNQKLRELSQIKEIDRDAQLDYSYTGDFNVEFFKKNLLVLELYGYEYPFGAAHGMPTKVFAHIDLVTGSIYELKDLFKPDGDYVKVLSDIIDTQIKEDDQNMYIFPDSYKGIAVDQPFYVSQDALYIYFAPYEIAAFAAGFPTFKIPFSQIASIINTGGEFWREFN
jgi:hypothetical protein